MSWFTEDRLQTVVWACIALALAVLLYVLAPVLAPFALAAMLAFLLLPGVDWIAARRLGKFAIPRWVGALAMILLLALLALGLLLILIPILQREGAALQAQFPLLFTKLNANVAPALREWFGINVQFNGQTLRDLLSENLGAGDVISNLLVHIRSGGAAVLGVIGLLVLVPVVLFYVLLDWHELRPRLASVIRLRWQTVVTGMLNEIDTLLAQFLRGQLTVMFILAVYYSAALAVAGFQTALPIGILTGLLIFIPYVGFAIGLLLALLAAALQFSSWNGLIAVAVIYGVGQALEGFLLTPRLVGERIGLHPLAVIFALLAFGQIFGFLGVLLALPASAALLVGLKRLKSAYLASAFYNAPEP